MEIGGKRAGRAFSSHLTMQGGLFKVVDGLYQVRNADISNLTIFEGETGIIIADPLGRGPAFRGVPPIDDGGQGDGDHNDGSKRQQGIERDGGPERRGVSSSIQSLDARRQIRSSALSKNHEDLLASRNAIASGGISSPPVSS